MRIKSLLSAFLGSLAFIGCAADVSAQDRWFVTVLAYEGKLNRPKLAHTFAVFTKASGDAKDPKDVKLENHTISWLPADLKVKILKLRPEKGVNLDLAKTLELARAHEARLALWGPFPIKKELYDLALKRIETLQSGKLKFLTLDVVANDRNEAVNCIHALSDLDPNQKGLETGTAHGDAASKMVVEHFRPWFLESQEDTTWLRDRLGLKDIMALK